MLIDLANIFVRGGTLYDKKHSTPTQLYPQQTKPTR